jgi:hypothetical protein
MRLPFQAIGAAPRTASVVATTRRWRFRRACLTGASNWSTLPLKGMY